MIVYDARRKITIEMPDQTSDDDVATLVKNFEAPPHPEEERFGSIRPYKPNFYEAHIKPVLRGMGATVDFPAVSPNKKVVSDRPIDAFMTKAIEGITFGGVKLKEYDQAVQNHPVAAVAGQITGEVGALLTTGGALQMTKLPRLAVAAGQAGAKVLPAATRFIPRAIMTGSTFGTKTFVNKVIEQHQEGSFNLEELGEAVAKDTALGGLLGSIGGIANARTAITAAGGLGFLSSKMEGGDNQEALLSGAIWAVFELVGSHGREARLRKEALEYLSQSFGAYAKNRNPKMTTEQAEALGREFVMREAAKVGGVDRIVKSEKNVLEFLEQLNQRVRKSIVPFKPEAKPAVEIPGPGPLTTGTPAQGQDLSTKAGAVVNQPTGPALQKPKVDLTDPKMKELDDIITAGGGKFIGVQPGYTKKSTGEKTEGLVMFNAPSGTTLALKPSLITTEAVAQRIKDAEAKATEGQTPAKSIFTETDIASPVADKEARDLFFFDDGDTPITAILKTMKDEINQGEAGGRIFLESGEVIGYSSSFPDYFKNKGLSKKHVNEQIDRVLLGKPITQRNKAILLDLMDGMIANARKEAEYYAKREAELSGQEGTSAQKGALIDAREAEARGDTGDAGSRELAAVEKTIRKIYDEGMRSGDLEMLVYPDGNAVPVARTDKGQQMIADAIDLHNQALAREKKTVDGQEISFNPQEIEVEKRTSQANRSGGLASKTGSGSHPIDMFEMDPAVEAKPAQFKLFEQVKKMAQKYVPRFGEKWNPRGTLGVYYPGTKNVFFNALNNISTVVHEVLHAVDDKTGNWKKIMRTVGRSKTGRPIYDPKTKQMRKELTKIYVEFYPGGSQNHTLHKRVVEGQAVFLQRMIEQPTETKKNYPYLYDQFLKKGGEYFQQEYLDLYNDARNIIREYQKLDPIGKIGARVLNDTNEQRRDSFLSPKERIIQEMVDNVYPLEAMAKKAGVHFTEKDPSLWTRVYNNTASMVNRNINTSKGYVTLDGDEFKQLYDFNWKSLVDDLHKEGKLEKFNYWLVARRTHFSYEKIAEMNKKIEEIKKQIEIVKAEIKASEAVQKSDTPEKVIESMMKEKVGPLVAEANGIIKERDKLATVLKNDGIDEEVAAGAFGEYKDDFQKYAEQFDKLVRADLELLANPNVGLITPETLAELSKNEGYATFKRDLYNEILGDEVPPMRGTGGMKASSLKQRKGSERAIIAPVMGSIRNHAEIMRKALKQIVINRVSNLAPKFPDLFQPQTVVRVPDSKGVMTYPQDKDPEILMAWKDGKRKPYKVNAELKKILVELLDFKNVHIFERYLTTASRMFTKSTTGLYVPFSVSNIVVDQFTAAAQTETNYTPVYDQIKIVRKIAADRSGKEAEYLNEYLMLGGERHTFVNWMDMSPNEFFTAITHEKKGLEKAVDLLGQGVEILAIPAQWSEIMTRAVEYIKARQAGAAQVVALEKAGRVSAPFHHIGRLGGGSVGRTTIKSIPYFNAQLQVLDQFFRNTMADPKKRERALAVVGAITVAMIGGLAGILAQGSKQQKELYDSIQPGELGRYIYFPHPTDKEKLARFRIPDQMGTMGVLVNMVIAQYWNDAKYKPVDFLDAATAWMPDQLNILDPVRVMMSWIPQIARPALEVATNMRTYPKVLPLESLADRKLEEGLRSNEATSELAKWLGKRSNISPIKIDHLIRGYLGRATDFVTLREVKNPLERDLYFTAGRKLNYYFELKEQNDQKWNSRDLREFSEEEKSAAISMRNQLKPIENLLDLYRKVEENDPENREKLNELRTKILDLIDTLHEEGKP